MSVLWSFSDKQCDTAASTGLYKLGLLFKMTFWRLCCSYVTKYFFSFLEVDEEAASFLVLSPLDPLLVKRESYVFVKFSKEVFILMQGIGVTELFYTLENFLTQLAKFNDIWDFILR